MTSANSSCSVGSTTLPSATSTVPTPASPRFPSISSLHPQRNVPARASKIATMKSPGPPRDVHLFLCSTPTPHQRALRARQTSRIREVHKESRSDRNSQSFPCPRSSLCSSSAFHAPHPQPHLEDVFDTPLLCIAKAYLVSSLV
jgi:hypothetical protein